MRALSMMVLWCCVCAMVAFGGLQAAMAQSMAQPGGQSSKSLAPSKSIRNAPTKSQEPVQSFTDDSIQELKLDWDRDSGVLALSTVVPIKLAPDIREALEKGLSIVFIARTELKRKRWWAWDASVDDTWRSYRLSYTPLSRQWTVRVASGSGDPVVRDRGLGLPLRFDSLNAALEAMSRINYWRFATADQLQPKEEYVLRFSFEMSMAQLPRPLQIGLIGDSTWRWSWEKIEQFTMESLR